MKHTVRNIDSQNVGFFLGDKLVGVFKLLDDDYAMTNAREFARDLDLKQDRYQEVLNTMTVAELHEWKSRKDALKTIGEFKALGRECRDKYGITDQQAISIINGEAKPQ